MDDSDCEECEDGTIIDLCVKNPSGYSIDEAVYLIKAFALIDKSLSVTSMSIILETIEGEGKPQDG